MNRATAEEHRIYQMVRNRERGVGPPARRDPALDLVTLMKHAGYASLTALGRALRLSGSVLAEAATRGVTIWSADRCAIELGYHPLEVWGDRWLAANDRYEQSDPLYVEGHRMTHASERIEP